MTLFEFIAGLASILGLFMSLGALLQAHGAKVAASQARDRILARTLGDEFELACVKMDQLLDFLRHDRVAEAEIRVDELASFLSEIPHRSAPYLGEASRNDLLNERAQMEIIGQACSASRGQVLGPKDKESLIEMCQRSRRILRENLARIKGRLDQGA